MRTTNFIISTGAALAFVFIPWVPASAVVVFDQSLPAFSNGLNSNGPDSIPGSPFTTNQQVADDFSLPSSSGLNGVSWFGAYHDGSIPASADFLIRIFDDSGGLPSNEIFSQTVSVLGVDSGFTTNFTTPGNIPILSYSATLTGVPTLLASTTYWLSVLEDDATTDVVWAWSTIPNPPGGAIFSGRDGEAAQWESFGNIGGNGSNMVFTLTADVPEPGTAALLVLGLTAVGVVRSRRPS